MVQFKIGEEIGYKLDFVLVFRVMRKVKNVDGVCFFSFEEFLIFR